MENEVKTFDGCAVLKCYALKRENLVKTEPCPFCGAEHTHGYVSMDGFSHRGAHCQNRPILRKGDNGQMLNNQDGYYLEIEN